MRISAASKHFWTINRTYLVLVIRPYRETDLLSLESILFDGSTVGTKQDYIEHFGEKPLGEFIRGIVGLDANAAQEAFADIVQTGNLRTDQMTFIQNIITYPTKNGVIVRKMLLNRLLPISMIKDCWVCLMTSLQIQWLV